MPTLSPRSRCRRAMRLAASLPALLVVACGDSGRPPLEPAFYVGLDHQQSQVVVGSTDAGATWSVLLRREGPSLGGRLVDFGDEKRGWALLGLRLFRTIDGGGSWQDQSGSIPPDDGNARGPLLGWLATVDDERAIVLAERSAGPRISAFEAWATDDGGRNWESGGHVAGNAESFSYQLPQICSTDRGLAFVMSRSNHGSVTTDSGRSWEIVYRVERDAPISSAGARATAVACGGDATIAIFGSSAVHRNRWLAVSEDAGASWMDRSAGLPQGEEGAIGPAAAVAGGRLWVAYRDGAGARLLHSADGGVTWVDQLVPLPPDGAIVDVAFVGDQGVVAVAAEPVQLFATDDGGATWRALGRIPDELVAGTRGASVDLVPGAPRP